MTDDLRTRVARAILSGHDWTEDQPDESTGWEALPSDWKGAYLAMADAALAAIEGAGVVLIHRSILYGDDKPTDMQRGSE